MLLAATARQPLFIVILSPIYLSIYICPQIFAAAKRRVSARRLRGVSKNSVG